MPQSSRIGASSGHSTSIKGALFQLYLSGNLAGYVSGGLIDTKQNSRDMTTIVESEETCERLLHSAIAALQPMVEGDEDLAIIRRWFFNPWAEANTITDLAMTRAEALKG